RSPCTTDGSRRSPRWFGGRRWRTCSSDSPAAPWWTEDAVTSMSFRVPRLAGRQADYWLTVLRRTFRGTLFTSFLMPFLYLTALGVGLGNFVDSASATETLGGQTYLQFIAPGLLATTAMQTAVFESTYPVM